MRSQNRSVLLTVIAVILIVVSVVVYNLFLKTPTKVTVDDSLKTTCINKKYNWIDQFNECESTTLSKEFCEKNNGKFFDCESPCRHQNITYCAEICMAVCKFK